VALLREGRRKVFELAGEVLVDEEELHRTTLSTPSFTSHASARKRKAWRSGGIAATSCAAAHAYNPLNANTLAS
jgi:transcription elongation factor